MPGPIEEKLQNKGEGVVTTDESGDTMVLQILPGGVPISVDFDANTILQLPKFPVRQDDIFQVSYAKSGCHWTWDILRLLKLGDEHRNHTHDKESYMVELNTFEDLEELDSPRVLNNHQAFSLQPKEAIEKKAKFVFVYRNIKDVIVSFYHHHVRFQDHYKYTGQKTFGNYIKRFLAGLVDGGDIFTYLREWEDAILNTPGFQCLVVSYENLKENPEREISRMAKFLGVNDDPEVVKRIAEETDIDAMRKRKLQNASKIMLDEKGQHIMYRKGQVGDWKNHFTVEQSELIDRVVSERLPNSKLFPMRYTI